MKAILLSIGIVFACLPASAGDLPDPTLTPGAVDATLTQQRLCAKSFRTGTVRSVPQSEKNQVYAEYNVRCKPGKATSSLQSCSDYEVDHLISLEIGGSNDIKNLWPQSYITKPLNAHVKDTLENKLHKLVCDGTATLGDVQHAISTDWTGAYNKYVGPLPTK